MKAVWKEMRATAKRFVRISGVALAVVTGIAVSIYQNSNDPTLDWRYWAGWQRMRSDAEFPPRDTAMGISHEGLFWLSNGYYHGHVVYRDLWSSRDGSEWGLINRATPYDEYSGVASYRGKIYAVLRSVWSSSDGATWSQVLPTTPFYGGRVGKEYGRIGHLVVFGDRLVFLVGSQVWRSSDGKEWEQLTATAPYGDRMGAAAIAFDGALWLMGGSLDRPNHAEPERGYKKKTSFNDVWMSRDGRQWTVVTDHAAWRQRIWPGATTYDGKMWVVAGFDNRAGRNLADTWYSNDGVVWRRLVTVRAFSPRHYPTLFGDSDAITLIAGNAWPVTNDVWRLSCD